MYVRGRGAEGDLGEVDEVLGVSEFGESVNDGVTIKVVVCFGEVSL